MAGQVPRISHFEWNFDLTHVVYQCVCQAKITAMILRNGQRDIQIQGSPVQPVVAGILHGTRLQASVTHCNFIVNTCCYGTKGNVDVGPFNED